MISLFSSEPLKPARPKRLWAELRVGIGNSKAAAGAKETTMGKVRAGRELSAFKRTLGVVVEAWYIG
jgi:hypothetical protein